MQIFCTLFIFSICSLPVSAQIKVDTSGKVYFGKQATAKAISIVDETTSALSTNPFQIVYKPDGKVFLTHNYNGYGMLFAPMGGMVIGRDIVPSSIGTPAAPLRVLGYNLGGGITVTHNGTSGYAGVAVELNNNDTYSYEARTSGSLKFYVTGAGIVNCTGTSTISDRSIKTEIEAIKSPLDKVMKLQGVTFRSNFSDDDEKELCEEELYELSKTRTPEITPDIFRQIQEEKLRKQMGVIAQEVEKVIPEVIRTREDGLKSVAYHEITGLLIEAIKEQQNEIEELRLEIEKMKSGSSSDDLFHSASNETSTTGIVNPLTSQCKLYQNSPNPFKERTEIRYFLPQEIQSAEIYIFNMQGSLLKKIPATQTGLVEIKGSNLPAGMYIYTLVADGQAVDTKRMILTK